VSAFLRAVYDSIRVELALIVGGIFIGFLKWVLNKKENKMAEIVQENKAFELKWEGDYLLLKVDPNKDGEPLLEQKIHIKEVPDEVLSLFKKA
jgi:hypothetical protein